MIPEHAISNVLMHMRRREVLFRIKTTAMFVFGIPLSLVGPLFLSFAFWVCACRFYDHDVRWAWFFWGAVVVVIPLLYQLEIRTRGDYLGTVATAPGIAAPPGGMMAPGSYGPILGIAAVAANPTQSAAGFVEIFLFGPRLVLGAWRQTRLAGHLKDADVNRAAEIIAQLNARDSGLDVEKLIRKGETFERLLPTFAYLSFHQWIGVNEGWNRIWILTEKRAILG
jgi:hypothetical protein